jgi:hypothetical protein
MLRNTMFALSLMALTGSSAFAASKVVATHHTTRTVAEGEAAPATDAKPADKKAKKAKKEKAPKAEKEAPKGDMKAPEAK